MTSIEPILTTTVAPSPPSTVVPDYVLDLERAAAYLGGEQLKRLRRAYEIGASAHVGQMRKSGEPYITHPVAVAKILAEQGLDGDSLIAAILHDTIEDTPITRDDLAREFGEDVAHIVEGVTKLDKLQFKDRHEAAAESFRKMMLAIAQDLRVILIKLADRLHNMRTLGAQSAEARHRIARETLEVYAPIAQRLGMNLFKAELQELGFKAMHPWRHAVLQKRIRSQPVVRREAMVQIESSLAQRLAREKLQHRLISRVKSPWSIYTKMRVEHKTFAQVMDVFGFRLVMRNVADCYHALGVVHSLYKPVDTRFRDFIAIPKGNGYQSLHTVLFGPYGAHVEVQIRTEEMDAVAERGIAAHWTYKNGGSQSSAEMRARNWIESLLSDQLNTQSSVEFYESVKIDLFQEEVYVFSPKGDILSLPRNATALDFAYMVHTDVGNHAVTARINGKLSPLRTQLGNGDRVEIVTTPASIPKPQWLEFVVTGKARTAIRQQLKQLEHEDAIEIGHRMLDRALEQLGSSIERIPAGRLESYLQDNKMHRLEALLAEIALGNWLPSLVASSLVQQTSAEQSGADGKPIYIPRDRLLINGTERNVISFASCCTPIPGDEVMGFHTAGKGIVVHRIDCANVPDYRKHPERWVNVGWDRNVAGDYTAALRMELDNRQGALAQVAAAIAEADSNIDRVEYVDRDSLIGIVRFVIEVRDRKHLADIIRRLRRLKVVLGINRI